MVQELLPYLPKELGTLALVLAMVGTLVGLGMWLIGAKYSRTLVTLVLVSIGGTAGLMLPGKLGWNIEGWAPAILLALVLGGSGFVMHRFWVGIGLGLVLAVWTGAVVWTLCKAQMAAVPQVSFTPELTWTEHIRALWLDLPPNLHHALPAACGAALLTGLSAAIFWPQLCVVVLYSLVGCSMLGTLGLCWINVVRPQWIRTLPVRTVPQLAVVMGMVLAGALVQWHLALSKRRSFPKTKPIIVVE